jgi:hypothetical protein
MHVLSSASEDVEHEVVVADGGPGAERAMCKARPFGMQLSRCPKAPRFRVMKHKCSNEIHESSQSLWLGTC